MPGEKSPDTKPGVNKADMLRDSSAVLRRIKARIPSSEELAKMETEDPENVARWKRIISDVKGSNEPK